MDITVIIATHNRSDVLEATLQGIAEADRDGHEVMVAVADNNSTDDTRDVVRRLASTIPVHYVFEEGQGKNRALNRALESTDLGDVVVFTDDDVVIPSDWFQQIAAACDAFPALSVFGGRIHARWPDGVSPPNWVHDQFVREFGYTVHDYGAEPREYPYGVYPFGPNMWVRSSVFAAGHRYREQIGPGWNATMGSESDFLLELHRAGYRVAYWPAADVGHRIRPDQLDPDWIAGRAEVLGRVFPYLYGPPQAELRLRRPALWRLSQRLALATSMARCVYARRPGDPDARVVRRVWTTFYRALHSEALRLPDPTK